MHAFHIGPHRIGHVIAKAETLEKAEQVLEDALNHIHIDVEEKKL